MRGLFVVGLCLLAACSSLQVRTDYSKDVDFSTFETFEYRDSDENAADSNTLAHREIVAAINAGMVAGGFVEVGSDADLQVTYYSAEEDSVRFTTQYLGYEAPGWSSHGRLETDTAGTVAQTVGAVVIDVWDRESNVLIWRSVVRDLLNQDAERTRRRIHKGIQKAFAGFPPNQAG